MFKSLTVGLLSCTPLAKTSRMVVRISEIYSMLPETSDSGGTMGIVVRQPFGAIHMGYFSPRVEFEFLPLFSNGCLH